MELVTGNLLPNPCLNSMQHLLIINIVGTPHGFLGHAYCYRESAGQIVVAFKYMCFNEYSTPQKQSKLASLQLRSCIIPDI